MFHDRALQEGPGSVVGGHDVGLPVPGELLQGVATATQPPLAVCHPVKALAVCVKAVAEPPDLGNNDEVLSVKPVKQWAKFETKYGAITSGFCESRFGSHVAVCTAILRVLQADHASSCLCCWVFQAVCVVVCLRDLMSAKRG